jgi:hypothetical protein
MHGGYREREKFIAKINLIPMKFSACKAVLATRNIGGLSGGCILEICKHFQDTTLSLKWMSNETRISTENGLQLTRTYGFLLYKALPLQFRSRYFNLPLRQHNVTDLIKALPGKSSVNSPTYTGGQQYSRRVFYVVCAVTVDFYCWERAR